MDVVLLKTGGFDHGSHRRKAVGARFGAIAKGEFAEDDDGSELTLGAIVMELGAGHIEEIEYGVRMKIDRNTLEIEDLHRQSDDRYWHAKTPVQRLRAVQLNREGAFGRIRSNPATSKS